MALLSDSRLTNLIGENDVEPDPDPDTFLVLTVLERDRLYLHC